MKGRVADDPVEGAVGLAEAVRGQNAGLQAVAAQRAPGRFQRERGGVEQREVDRRLARQQGEPDDAVAAGEVQHATRDRERFERTQQQRGARVDAAVGEHAGQRAQAKRLAKRLDRVLLGVVVEIEGGRRKRPRGLVQGAMARRVEFHHPFEAPGQAARRRIDAGPLFADHPQARGRVEAGGQGVQHHLETRLFARQAQQDQAIGGSGRRHGLEATVDAVPGGPGRVADVLVRCADRQAGRRQVRGERVAGRVDQQNRAAADAFPVAQDDFAYRVHRAAVSRVCAGQCARRAVRS